MDSLTSHPERRCACGCGELVKSRRGVYARGHHLRASARTHGAPGRLPERACATCGKALTAKQRGQAIYCSNTCYGKARMTFRAPKLALGGFLFDRWQASRQSLWPYAASIGISGTALTNILSDTLPKPKTLAKLRAVFGDALPDATAYRMPDTAREAARRAAQSAQHPAHSRAANEKRRAALKGRPKPRDAVERSWATRRANGAADRAVAGLKRWSATPEAGAVKSLISRLRGNPSPDKQARAAWARAVSLKCGLSAARVQILWRPYLQERGLLGTGGQKTLERRHDIIEALMETWPRVGRSRRFAAGFWDEAARLVNDGVAAGDTDGPALNNWWSQHPRFCAR